MLQGLQKIITGGIRVMLLAAGLFAMLAPTPASAQNLSVDQGIMVKDFSMTRRNITPELIDVAMRLELKNDTTKQITPTVVVHVVDDQQRTYANLRPQATVSIPVGGKHEYLFEWKDAYKPALVYTAIADITERDSLAEAEKKLTLYQPNVITNQPEPPAKPLLAKSMWFIIPITISVLIGALIFTRAHWLPKYRAFKNRFSFLRRPSLPATPAPTPAEHHLATANRQHNIHAMVRPPRHRLPAAPLTGAPYAAPAPSTPAPATSMSQQGTSNPIAISYPPTQPSQHAQHGLHQQSPATSHHVAHNPAPKPVHGTQHHQTSSPAHHAPHAAAQHSATHAQHSSQITTQQHHKPVHATAQPTPIPIQPAPHTNAQHHAPHTAAHPATAAPRHAARPHHIQVNPSAEPLQTIQAGPHHPPRPHAVPPAMGSTHTTTIPAPGALHPPVSTVEPLQAPTEPITAPTTNARDATQSRGTRSSHGERRIY